MIKNKLDRSKAKLRAKHSYSNGEESNRHGVSSNKIHKPSILGSQSSQTSKLLSTSQLGLMKTNEGSLVRGNATLFSDDEEGLSQTKTKMVKPKSKRGKPHHKKQREEKTYTEPDYSEGESKDVDEMIEIPSEDDEDEFYRKNANNKRVLHIYKSLVSKKLMYHKWVVLPPRIVEMLESILELYIEETISGISFQNRKDKLRFRNLVKDDLVTPLIRKLRSIRLPNGIKESHLDQEELYNDNIRLESNYNANLKQLRALEEEEQKEIALLKRETKFQANFKSRVGRHQKKMRSEIKALEQTLGDTSLLTALDDEKSNTHHTKSLNLAERSLEVDSDAHYDPSRDPDLQQAIENLSRHLTSVSRNVEPFEPMVDVLDRVSSLLQLLQ
ncbi:hypothetical protein CANARDRAFT_29698 [[Candida] arabinofermentans NRRL YB-2248]|uniref:Uncharacterized protein n=1 Tax=[Candida] arabinofermentans NRRL YB-2248 TaxID=983967 RepID=A0A1E4SW29_9ASCO|nr:hypothetical protein CANARDRAFT_29698 [[Candida] arabinofermentans NRRL YB-2248]